VPTFGGGKASSTMNQDFVDLLRTFVDHDVRFLAPSVKPPGPR
jgi:hypothetical protein